MELRQVRYFIAVAEQLNFSKAAQMLHIAQPPLSRQIHELEDELGVQLFERDTRHVRMTAAGRAFLEEARALIVQAGQATETARRAQDEEAGSVRIGIASGLGGAVARVIGEHCQRYPTVEIQCKDVFSSLQSESLRKHEIDVGFLRPPIDDRNLLFEVLFEEDFVVVLPKNHRLARRRSLRLRDVADEPLFLFDRNFSCGLYDRILGLYQQRGYSPHITVTHTEPHEEAGTVMVAAGRGIYLGVGAIATRRLSGVEVAVVPLREPDAKIEVCAAWRKNEHSTAVLAFLESVRRMFGLGRDRKSPVAARAAPAATRTAG